MASALNSEVLQSSLEEKARIGVPSKVLPYSKRPRRILSKADENSGSPTFTKSLAMRSQTVPEPCIIGQATLHQANFTMPTQSYSVHAEYPQNTLLTTENLSKETSSEKSSVPMENTSIVSLNYPYSMPFNTEIGSIGINHLNLSQDTGSIGKIQVPLDISKLGNARTALYSTTNSNLEPNNLGAAVNKSHANEGLNVASLASPLHLQNFQIDASLLADENINIPQFPHNAQKNMQEGNIRHFVFVGPKQLCDGQALTDPNPPSNNLYPYSNLPPGRPALAKGSKPLNQDLKPMVNLGKYSNRSLHEMLSVLENWARSGLDNAFNRPVKLKSVHVANLEKKLENGLGLLKEIFTRINTLMKAANKFLNTDMIVLSGLERIRCELMTTGVKMCSIIKDIELQISNDFKKLKSTRDSETISDLEEAREDIESQDSSDQKSLESISDDQFVMMETSSEDTEQETQENIKQHVYNRHKKLKSISHSDISTKVADREAKPNIIITKAYTLVTERLPLLWIQMENFRAKIRAFCLQIDRLV